MLLALALSFAAAPAVAGEALDVAPTADLRPVPEVGAGGVPLNPLILVVDPFVEVQLVDDGAAVVPTTSTTAFAGDGFTGLRRVLSAEVLRQETAYRVIAVADDGSGNLVEQQELTRFTTGAVTDDVAPADVDVDIDDSGFVSVSADEEVVVADVNFGSRGSQLHRLEDGRSSARLFGSDVDLTVSVIALDAAGNAAAPVDAVLRGSASRGGCGGAQLTPALLLTGVLLRRRRAPRR